MERQARSGKQRSAEYRARLAARAEPPRWRVADEFMIAVVVASRAGETLNAQALVAMVAETVVSSGFSAEGVDNVLARVVADVDRRRG